MMGKLRILLFFAALLGALPVFAVQPDEMLANPQLEARARALSRELRCMVCQNQSIDDSDAGLARDLRLLVRERLVKGDSDQQVIDYLTARYGEFILLKPRFETQTALLWLMPAAFVLIGGSFLFLLARRRRGAVAEATLTPAEEARLSGVVGRNQD
jgi:cytochrome c-type biogenesis protein CcmH